MAIVFTSTTPGGSNPLPFDPKTWWRCSSYNIPQDFHLCAYANLLEVVSAGEKRLETTDTHDGVSDVGISQSGVFGR